MLLLRHYSLLTTFKSTVRCKAKLVDVRPKRCPDVHASTINGGNRMFTRRPPAPPPRDFPLLLRREWRIDSTPQAGRLRALAYVAARPKTARPAPYRLVAA